MEWVEPLIKALNHGPGTVVGAIALLTLGFAAALHLSRHNTSTATSANAITASQIDTLKALLEGQTTLLKEMQTQNKQQFDEIRSLTVRVKQLEALLIKNGLTIPDHPDQKEPAPE